MYLLNGTQRISLDVDLVIGEGEDAQTYPAGTLKRWTANELATIGITEEPDPERKDERYYYVNDIDEAPFIENLPKPLDEVKTQIAERIKGHRDTLSVAGVQIAGNWFHNDLKSRSQWERMANKTEKLLAAGALTSDEYLLGGQPVLWKSMTGTYVPLTLGFIQDAVDALELQEAAIFMVSATHEQTMKALTDIEDIINYDFSAGWPAVYGG